MHDEFIGTMPVQDKHRFDVASLERFMRAHVAGYRGPLQVEQFKGGQSNPTFLLQDARRSATCSGASRRASCCPRPMRWTASTA